ncbi:MAG: glycosyltransferase family 2 protein [Desulfobacteraceae bacterium]|nr:glycosyltransferase family 2 protein [Desulfobacteraceae bacterium]
MPHTDIMEKNVFHPANNGPAEQAPAPSRSFVIPVLDMSPHSPYSIQTLLNDLSRIQGEVICIFNSNETFTQLKDHPRIDKYCYNKLNAGVSRSWNIGINMAEARSVFIMNADLHVLPLAIEQLESYLYELPNAVMVGPQGTHLDFRNLRIVQYFEKGGFDKPIRTHDVSGFFFALHLERFLKYKLCFDVRYSPCFMEEWDMGMQVIEAGLACYAVPVHGFEHEWGISSEKDDRPINYFGRTIYRNGIIRSNREKFRMKWFGTEQ